jgi:hypothetical protein
MAQLVVGCCANNYKMAQLIVDCGSDQMLQNFGCNCSTLPHGKTHMSFFTTKTYKRNSCGMFVRGNFFELSLPVFQIHG